MPELCIRAMASEDTRDCMVLKDASGWNQTPRDWETLRALCPNGCFVAVRDGQIVGSVTTTRYGDGLAWIGMLLVHPSHRHQGIGTALLDQAMRSLTDVATVKLDASAEGRPLYAARGFRVECEVVRLRRGAAHPGAAEWPDGELDPIRPADWAAILRMDRAVFGADRSALLEAWRARAPGLALAAQERGILAGYCLGREGSAAVQIGPIAGDGLDSARRLVLGAVRRAGKAAVIVDAMTHAPEWTQFLGELGFREQRRFTRMFTGPNSSPGLPAKTWCAAGPEVG